MSVPKDVRVDFQQVFNALPGLSVVLAPDAPQFTILAVSDACLQAFAQPRHLLLGRGGLEWDLGRTVPLDTISDRERSHDVLASLERAIASRAPDTISLHRRQAIRRASSDDDVAGPVWHATHTPVFDDRGVLTYLIQQLDGVTGTRSTSSAAGARGMVGATAAAGGHWLGDLADAMPQLVWTASPQGSVSSCNARASDYAGLDPHIDGGWEWRLAVHPDDTAATERAWNTALDGDRYQHTHRLRTADGTYRWHLSRAILVGSPDGIMRQWIGTTTDIHDLHDAQAALREREAFVRSVLDSLPEHIAVVDLAGVVQAVNEPWARMALENGGMTEAAAVGVNYLDVCRRAAAAGDDYARAALAGLDAVRSGERTDFAMEYPCHAADRERWFSMYARRAHDDRPYIVLVHADITERNRVDEELRRREALYRSIGEAIDYGVWVCTPDGRNTYASESFLRLVGMTQEHCSNFGWGDALHPEEADATMAAWQACVRTGQAWDRQHRFRGTDGAWRHVLARGVPVRNDRGDIVSWAGINLDIGHLKATEDALRASEQRMRLATEATEVGIWEWNVTAGTLRWDAQMFRIYGMAPTVDGLVDERTWSNAVLPEDLPHEEAVPRDALPGGGRRRRRFRIRRADTGDSREVEAVETVRADLPDGAVWVVGTNLDITDRMRIERDLREADRRKDLFLATLAHELRNPLVPVRNSVHALRLKKWSEPDVQWAMNVIDRQVQHLARLIEDLMDVSRISRQRIELRREHVDLAQAVREAVEACRSVIDAGGHDMNVTLPRDPLIVDADPTRLTQVFQNLLNNAAKYTERGGRLHVHVRRDGGDAVVAVKDSGIGIPADRLPTIFAMFSQVEGTLSRSQGGLGIGLHLVRWLVDMHGGQVDAISDGPGTGSTFVVRLPLVQTRTTESAAREEGEGTSMVADLKVLVVDDNADGADTSAILLQMVEYTVCIANDGETALRSAEEFRPDVVLLDLGLPKLSGHDVARAIRQRPWGQATVIVAVTGWGQEEDKRRSEEAGFDHHLVKPVDPKVLLGLLARVGKRKVGELGTASP